MIRTSTLNKYINQYLNQFKLTNKEIKDAKNWLIDNDYWLFHEIFIQWLKDNKKYYILNKIKEIKNSAQN